MIKFNVSFFLVALFLACSSQDNQIYSTIISPKTGNPIDISNKISSQYLVRCSFSLENLRILRNEIYARKGYVFKSNDLTEYFSKYDWYNPLYSANEIDNYLDDIDKANIKSIKALESKIKQEHDRLSYIKVNYEDYLELINSYSNGFEPLGQVCILKDSNFNPLEKNEYKYIELAKTAVEKAIEENEEKAMEYVSTIIKKIEGLPDFSFNQRNQANQG